MKRICSLLLTVLLCALVCFPAFADMGAPDFNTYKVTLKADTAYYEWASDSVTKESYFKKEGTLPAGTVVEISGEYETGGEMYGHFYGVRLAGKDLSGYIRIRDLDTDKSSVFPRTSGYQQSVPVRLRVTAPNGVIVYAGPSASYAQVTVIPQGTELTVDTLDQQSYGSSTWMFVTYGGKSGWVRCFLYDGSNCPMAELLLNGGTGTVWIVKDGAFLCDKNWNKVVAVPKGEKLTFDAFNHVPHSDMFYVTYQGKSGVIHISDDVKNTAACSVAEWNLQNIPVGKSCTATFYEDPDGKQQIGTVSYQEGETVRGEYLFYAALPDDEYGCESMIYTQKDGQYGWVRLNEISTDVWKTTSPYMPRLSDSKASRPVETTTAAPAPTTTAPPATTTVPSSSSTTSTPSTEAQNSLPETTDADMTFAEYEPFSASAFEAEFVPAEETTEADDAVPGRVLPPGAVILICVTAAIALALTVIVILLLIRSKKQNGQYDR